MPSSSLFLFLLTMVLFLSPFVNYEIKTWHEYKQTKTRATLGHLLTSASSASVLGARNLFPPKCESVAAHFFSNEKRLRIISII
jgi:hypothetical protein